MCETRVCYVWDEDLINRCDQLPAVAGRVWSIFLHTVWINRPETCRWPITLNILFNASMVHGLIHAYDLHSKIKVVRSSPCSYDDLKEFHSDIYLDHLKKLTNVDEEYMTNEHDEEFGIGYDCPPVANMFDLVSTIAGGSTTAAKCLLLGIADVAINWCGGWHHAKRFGAEGFCYVNDIVLAIEKLRKKFPKVLYVDLDVHHGNGVQDAYNISKSVFTLSIHKYEPGFYPGTGGIEDIGSLTGKGYTSNVPLHAGYSDETLEYLFEKIFNSIYTHFTPKAIVVQCGADALAHDPNGGARLSARGYSTCVETILSKRLPTLLLGGGGYKNPNAARLWASLTAIAAGITLDENIPEHNFWPQYGPDFTLALEPTLAKDNNKQSYLDECIATIRGNLEKYVKEETDNNSLRRLNEMNNIKHSYRKETSNCDKVNRSNSGKSKNVSLKACEDVYAFVD